LSLTQLLHTRLLTLPDLIARFTSGPARVLGLKKGSLAVGADADVTVLDPDREWTFDISQTASKASNSPFHRWPLRGKAVATIVGGKRVWVDERESVSV
jgi:dihydroorotase